MRASPPETWSGAEDTTSIFSLLLLDLNQPDMDGYQLLCKIRKSDPKIPIIVQSAFRYSEELEKCNESGVTEHLTKPIFINDLLDAVKRIFNA